MASMEMNEILDDLHAAVRANTYGRAPVSVDRAFECLLGQASVLAHWGALKEVEPERGSGRRIGGYRLAWLGITQEWIARLELLFEPTGPSFSGGGLHGSPERMDLTSRDRVRWLALSDFRPAEPDRSSWTVTLEGGEEVKLELGSLRMDQQFGSTAAVVDALRGAPSLQAWSGEEQSQ